MTTPQRVKVSLTVEIDAESWMQEYGCDKSEVREDVQRHVEQMVRQQLDSLGVGR